MSRYDVESLRQAAGDFMPRGVCERVAVQEQERRALATVSQEDVGTARTNPSRLEALEQTGVGRKRRRRGRGTRRGLREDFTGGSDELRPKGSRRGGDELSAVQLHNTLPVYPPSKWP
jgi:hypothetical protein